MSPKSPIRQVQSAFERKHPFNYQRRKSFRYDTTHTQHFRPLKLRSLNFSQAKKPAKHSLNINVIDFLNDTQPKQHTLVTQPHNMHPTIQSPQTVSKSVGQSSDRSIHAPHHKQSQYTMLNTLTHMSVQHDSSCDDAGEPAKQQSL